MLRKNGSYQQFYLIKSVKRLFSAYLDIISIEERKDGASKTDEFESIEVVAKKRAL